MNWDAPPRTSQDIIDYVITAAEKLKRSFRPPTPEYMIWTSRGDYYPIRKAFDNRELPKCIKDVVMTSELVPGQVVLTRYIPPITSMEIRYDKSQY